ncbi:MAG: hypothetical protein APF80_13490 [Alphaproteobacteria bacterium BRH_c36]|nr:MAG: hypothetical protein APF80_13490 [Alphaproteobacteria bacterium BRH_c36]
MRSNFQAVAAVGLLMLATAGEAIAGDYYNACTTADPRFEINDDTLYSKSPPQNPIDFEILDKSTTSERRGYCLSQGKKFDFEGRNSTMRIRFNYQGSRIETTATCEFASSGLPAAYNCEREVVTFDSTNGGGGSGSGGAVGGGSAGGCGAGSVWSHNGSEMRLLSQGSIRRFVYERPRRGLSVSPCDVVFVGEKQGENYIGTAYVFSRRCGPIGYPVSGPVSSVGPKVTLYGQSPRRRNDCSITGYRDDTLVFEYLRSE